MNNRLLQIILEELHTTFRDSLSAIEKKLIESGMSGNQAKLTSTKIILQELSKSELVALATGSSSDLEKFIDKSTEDNDTFEKTKKELGDLVDKEPGLSKAVSKVMLGLLASRNEKLAKATKTPTKKDKAPAKTSAPTAPKATPKSKAKPAKPSAPKATSKPKTTPTPEPKSTPKPTAPTPTVGKKSTPTAKSVVGKTKKKVKKLTPAQKAKRVMKKYKDFTDGGDDKQISKKFTVSKADKEKLPKFGKVGKQVKGGTKKQAADRDTAAVPHRSGDAFSQGDKGDSVSCLRGRVMDDGDYQKRDTVAATILGGGADKEQTPLPFGRNRWTQQRKQEFSTGRREEADSKAIKAVVNFMGAAARFGYDPVKYWSNFLWATATDITLKGKPRSPKCLDPRNKADVDKHLALQKQNKADGKNKIKDKRKQHPLKQKNEVIEQFVHATIAEETHFDSKLPRLPEDFCYNGCTEQYLEEASKRNVKLIPKYKKYVAGLRQKTKGMTLDQFLDLIKYKE